ncbi:BMP family ABC transporter substrate-binding protein [Mycoplasma leonicaptivi]|uniref:BMP family ABC transporter substrate-binding protein n=1 Tax=Mycoplasma leonicaptivi TaxID=36742 RepID=UPI00048149A4|nr:BMP family ABC transporter substrate-binding protein [Mycoplasma leonicaptivi]
MKKSTLKKFLLTISASTFAVAPMIAASCGSTEKTGTSGSSGNIGQKTQTQNGITNINTRNFSLTPEMEAIAKKQNMVLITDTGKVTDKSFNQSSWEALQKLDEVTMKDGKKTIKIANVEPKNASAYEQSYLAALQAKRNVWVLVGFGHGEHIKKFINENKAKLIENDVKIFGIDFAVEGDYEKAYSLNFKVNEASYITGYALAKFNSEAYPNDPSKRVVGSFGGGNFDGVTDFITGFLKGIADFNAENPTLQTKVSGNIQLNSGFQPGPQMSNVIETVIGQKPNVILPVAGPATTATLESLRSKNLLDSKFVIGVDVDQSNALDASFKGNFVTSIEKNMAQALYDSILEVVFKDTSRNVIGDQKVVYGSYKQKWVGLSNSTIKDETLRSKMQKAIDESKAKFETFDDAKIAFINNNKLAKLNSTEAQDKVTNNADLITRLTQIVGLNQSK